MPISNCKVEYLSNPLGMDERRPRFSYVPEGIVRQRRRRIVVITGKSGHLAWDSGLVESRETLQIRYEGEPLQPFTRYHWQVEVEDEQGKVIRSDPTSFFETGFLDTPWKAKWIARYGQPSLFSAPARFRKDFHLEKRVVSARLCVTAFGFYEAWVNGQPVTETVFNPGWTQYDRRVQYQVYDVTRRLRKGCNALAVRLGDGWCCGKIASNWGRDGDWPAQPHLKAELRLVLADGSVQVIATDKEWFCAALPGAIRYSDLYAGEYFEAWRDDTQWKLHGDTSVPAIALKESEFDVQVVWHRGAFMRRMRRVAPVKVIERGPGHWLVDFGQNLAGREHIMLKNVEQGRTILVLHGEMLNPDGSAYTENLRTALATTTVVCGNGPLDYEPHFTSYGFRYLDVTGFPEKPSAKNLCAEVIYSDLEQTAEFHCSEPMVNQLYSNIVWGQRGNFLDVPTDCPQRDERYGWTGDTQVFMDMATFNMEAPAFYRKWLEDLKLQHGGVFSYICPNPWGTKTTDATLVATAWNDAGIVCPWLMYLKYADRTILKELYPNMVNLINRQIERAGGRLIVDNARYGDWLNIDAPTPTAYLSTAYLAGMTALVGDIAEILGYPAEAQAHRARAAAIREAFGREYFTAKGVLKIKTQTAALLALHFGLAPANAREKTVAFLVKDIRETRRLHLSTGFVGTPLLLRTLSDHGHVDLAYDLLCQTTYPGWLYPITLGATTMWERWNSYSEKGFGNVSMNSFNHYAYGAVGDWFFSTMGGIRPDPNSPAFLDFTLAPQFGHRFGEASVSYNSVRGVIRSAWKRILPGQVRRKGGSLPKGSSTITWQFTVPANTTARVVIPDGFALLEGEKSAVGVDHRFTAGSYTLHLRPTE
ncbi:MAG: family 78 glycoside hydrolase catalytic domain [Victivallales bacterium]|nr:family 78 glycoside hydrolase catalytic domain [Victivallales bacterium]